MIRWLVALCAALTLTVAVPQSVAGAVAGDDWYGVRFEPTATTSTIVGANGPFFVWGATFFYERIPRDHWASTLETYKRFGITTIDLYIPWNWHEVADGEFDFDGSTNPRRDLVGLLQMIRNEGFAIVVRPGPVIRNEWRNGGYPAWLLRQPAYDMPLHDILEGRYPATATLQNAHSDDAAAEWLHNSVHMRYAERWLRRVARELKPYEQSIVGWQLDDDEGAYIDNQTWPAPHLRTYLERLAAIVRRDIDRRVPLFINTYEMKVPASSPVLAFGNWYQSDAYSFGEHDRTELEFATALLQTQPHAPIVASEFQAGWLQGAGDAYPRPADPANTLLALHTLLQLGAHGVIDFPLQDTWTPSGWEAPFANAFYAWDAALDLNGSPQDRSVPTAAFGRDIVRYGKALAAAHRVVDAAIVWPVSAYDEKTITNDDVFGAVARTKEALRFCRAASLTCDLVDLRYGDDALFASYPIVLVPTRGSRLPLRARERLRLAALSRTHVVETDAVPFPGGSAQEARPRADALLARARSTRAVDGVADAVMLVTDDPTPQRFIDVVNLTQAPIATSKGTWRAPDGHRMPITDAPVVPPRSAMLIRISERGNADDSATPLDGRPWENNDRSVARSTTVPAPNAVALRDGLALPLTRPSPFPTPPRFVPGLQPPEVYRAALLDDGSPDIILENTRLRIVIAPAAGARVVSFVNRADGFNRVTTVGALRDEVTVQPPPSKRDYIAKYTHDYPAGFFNRQYESKLEPLPLQAISNCGPFDALAVERYTAPDVVGGPLDIERSIELMPKANAAIVTIRQTFHGNRPAAQHLVSRTSLAGGAPATRATWRVYAPDERAIPPGTTIDVAGNAFAFVGADGRADAFSWDDAPKRKRIGDDRFVAAPEYETHIRARVIGRADDVDVVFTIESPAARFAFTTDTVDSKNTAADFLASARLVYASLVPRLCL